MGGINNKAWRLKAVLRTLGALTAPACEAPPSPRAGWTAHIRLSPGEIHSPDRRLRFQAPRPPFPTRPAIKAEPAIRIGEQRGWIDPAP